MAVAREPITCPFDGDVFHGIGGGVAVVTKMPRRRAAKKFGVRPLRCGCAQEGVA